MVVGRAGAGDDDAAAVGRGDGAEMVGEASRTNERTNERRFDDDDPDP